MASPRFVAVVAALVLVVGCVGAEGPDRFRVGDEQGWRVPDRNETTLYNRWASRIRFRVGDSIYFEYTNDSVLVVDKRGYYHCNATDPIHAYHDGATLVVLDRAGPFYFISGEVDHCKRGQRLTVDVDVAFHPPSQPPSLTPPSPLPPRSDQAVPTPVVPSPSSTPNAAVRPVALWVGAVVPAAVAPMLLSVGL